MDTLFSLDCSAERCSLALWANGEILAHRDYPSKQVAERILDHVDELLSAEGILLGNLSALAVGVGPGAFTGVRLAVSTIQGMALARDLPVFPVSTLAAIARASDVTESDGPLVVLQDARMGEVYSGWFMSDGTAPIAISAETVGRPSDLRQLHGADRFVVGGNAYAIFEDDIVAAIGSPARIVKTGLIAAGVAMIAGDQAASTALQATELRPTYIRNSVALTLAEQKSLREST